MGIGKSKITPSINVDDMFKTAEISYEIETEKLDADKQLAEVREAKEVLQKIHQNLQDAIKAEGNAAFVLQAAMFIAIAFASSFTASSQAQTIGQPPLLYSPHRVPDVVPNHQ